MARLPFARPIGAISAVYSALQSGESGVAQIAVFRPPRDLVVMARAAKLSIYDICHEHIVGAGAHLEADLGVANRAVVADAMEPVRENHRTHACFFRPFVEYHIAILGMGGRWRKQREQA
jgi:hypothetical protein